MRQWKLYLLLAFIFTFSLSFIHAQQVDNQVDSLPQIDTIASVRRYIPEFTPQQVNTRSSFLISSITVVGNKKTRSNIILREVPFTAGMSFSLSLLIDLFKQGEQQIMNTALFHSVRIYASKFEGNCLEITVEVVERWYLFPFPFFDLVDRNINQWLIDQKASLQRVNYGLKLLYNNTTGHNDKLRLWLINGYTRELSISYEKPYFDRKMQWGFRLAARTGKGREINYNTIEDKQVFLRTPDFIRSFASVGGELTYRKKLFARHNFGIFYFREKVEDTVLRANPDYFRVRGSINQFPELYYQFTYAKMDYIPYFEYNVVDGVAGGYLRSSFARELFRVNIPLPGFIRKRASLSTVPFKVFGKLYSNAGYVYSPEPGFNFLQNKFLHAAGFGIDILSLYDLTIRIEYSFNNFGQNGLFLHRTSSF